MATWNAWGNQYWPAKYLIDAKGQVRDAHFGEGDYDKTEAAIRALLRERGDARLGATRASGHDLRPVAAGDARRPTSAPSARRAGSGPARRATGRTPTRRRRRRCRADRVRAVAGRGRSSGERAIAGAGRRDRRAGPGQGRLPRAVTAARRARRRRRCCSTASRSRRRGPAPTSTAGVVTVDQPAALPPRSRWPRSQRHRLTLRVGAGVGGYAFTFG